MLENKLPINNKFVSWTDGEGETKGYLGLMQAQTNTLKLNLSAIKTGNRQVNPKMILRLVNWMEKMCLQTMEFSYHTFEMSVRILLKYLSQVDEPVASLQLLASASMFLASKLNESTVVAAVSYVECSKNIFTEEDLYVKERALYKQIGFKPYFLTLQEYILYVLESFRTRSTIRNITPP